MPGLKAQFVWTFAVWLLVCSSTVSRAEPDLRAQDLPPDAPQVSEVVHRMRYPLHKSILTELSSTYLYGDKFLRTYGADLDFRYFWREKWAIGLGGGWYSSAQVDEIRELKKLGRPPLLLNPKYSARLTLSSYPVYGKLAFGDSIAHFRLFADLGLHFAGLRAVGANDPPLLANPDSVRWRWGPYGALGAWFALGRRLSLQLKLSFAWEAPYLEEGGEWRRVIGVSSGLGWRFAP